MVPAYSQPTRHLKRPQHFNLFFSFHFSNITLSAYFGSPCGLRLQVPCSGHVANAAAAAQECLQIDLDQRIQGRMLIGGFKKLLKMELERFGTPTTAGVNLNASVPSGSSALTGPSVEATIASRLAEGTPSNLLGFGRDAPSEKTQTPTDSKGSSGSEPIDHGGVPDLKVDLNALCQRSDSGVVGFGAMLAAGQGHLV